MNNLKRVAILFILLVTLTGCGKKEDLKNTFAVVEKKMDDLSNYVINMEMEAELKAPGIELIVPATMEAKVDEKSGISKSKITFEIMGMKLSTESYTQTVDGKTVTYTKEIMEDTWVKEVSDDNSEENDILFITKHSKKIDKKKSDDKTTNRYQVTLSNEDAVLLLGKTETGSVEDYNIKKDIVFDIYVDKKSNYITKIVMDLKDVMEMEGFEVTSAMVTLTFSDFNKVGTVTIPEDVITSAIDQSDDDWNFDDPEITNPEM